MVTKELIYEEIESVSGENLQELYDLIREFARSKQSAERPSLMARLMSISIDGPEDFSQDHDRYVVGEKHATAHPG